MERFLQLKELFHKNEPCKTFIFDLRHDDPYDAPYDPRFDPRHDARSQYHSKEWRRRVNVPNQFFYISAEKSDREKVHDLMDQHFRQHMLIPKCHGSYPTVESIKMAPFEEFVTFCSANKLFALLVYLYNKW
jgi:hypothetical protein